MMTVPKQEIKEEKFETKFETKNHTVTILFSKGKNPSPMSRCEQPVFIHTTYKLSEKEHPENTMEVYISPEEKHPAFRNRDVLFYSIEISNLKGNTGTTTHVEPDVTTASGRRFRDVFDAAATVQERPDVALFNFIDMYISDSIRNLTKTTVKNLSHDAARLEILQGLKDELQDTWRNNVNDVAIVKFVWKDMLWKDMLRPTEAQST